jgi:hypothetical protein
VASSSSIRINRSSFLCLLCLLLLRAGVRMTWNLTDLVRVRRVQCERAERAWLRRTTSRRVQCEWGLSSTHWE